MLRSIVLGTRMLWAGRGDPGILSLWMKASKVQLAAVRAALGLSHAPRTPGGLLWRVCGRLGEMVVAGRVIFYKNVHVG